MIEEKTVVPTSIRLSPDIYAKVVEMAKKDCRSITKEIEFIIKQYIQIKEG